MKVVVKKGTREHVPCTKMWALEPPCFRGKMLRQVYVYSNGRRRAQAKICETIEEKRQVREWDMTSLSSELENEKMKLLEERSELMDLLRRLELAGAVYTPADQAKEEDVLISKPLNALSTKLNIRKRGALGSSPAVLRQNRYKSGIVRQKNQHSSPVTHESGSKESVKVDSLAKENSSKPGYGGFSPSFVSNSSEESLSIASTSGSTDAVTTMLQERRHLNLLNREEEAALIEKAQFCFKVERAVEELERVHGSIPTYDQLAMALAGQKKALSSSKLKSKYTEAMEARRFMLDHNVRLVVHLAHRYRGKGVSLGDLVQEGIQGLLTALEKFDLSRNLKFSTYATWWIKQSLIRGICNYSRDVRLPVHITDTLQKMNKMQKEASSLGVSYTPETIASMMGCKVTKVKSVLESTKAAISLEVLCGNNTGNSIGNEGGVYDEPYGTNATRGVTDVLTIDTSDDVGETLDSELYEKFLQEDVDAALRMLPPRERNIIRMRFGLTPIDDMCLSLVDIGSAYGLTRERVRQMEARALNKLRQPKLSTKLKKYVNKEEN